MAAKQCFRFALLSTAISGFYNCIIWLLGHVCNVLLAFLFVFLGVEIAYSQSAELWFQVRYEKRMMDMSACAIYTKCDLWKAHTAGKSAKMRRQTYINNHFARNMEKRVVQIFHLWCFPLSGISSSRSRIIARHTINHNYFPSLFIFWMFKNIWEWLIDITSHDIRLTLFWSCQKKCESKENDFPYFPFFLRAKLSSQQLRDRQ